jgi:hypothetical protein
MSLVTLLLVGHFCGGSCVLASRCTTTGCLVGIGILSAALSPSPHFRFAAAAFAASAETPRAVQLATVEAAGGAVRVSGVSIQAGKAGETVVDVATSSPARYRVLQLENPRRIKRLLGIPTPLSRRC